MKPLILPSEIPWQDMRGELLEQFVYWLLDDMGAKDLEWRRGGKRATSADGGRDLEAFFYASSPDGEMRKEKWWIQVKGRSSTVEAAAVREFLVTAEASNKIDVLVVVTNTQFSNPTRDWVKQWQSKHLVPTVKLWDRDTLERLALQHPSVVARNFPNALSSQGSLQALTSRFWNQLQYANSQLLNELWNVRAELNLAPESLIALIAGEISLNSLGSRPWHVGIDSEKLFEIVVLVISNFSYFILRLQQVGANEEMFTRVVALILCAGFAKLPDSSVVDLVLEPFLARDIPDVPSELNKMVSGWMADAIKRELQQSCVLDCVRISSDPPELTKFDLLSALQGTSTSKVNDVFFIESMNDPCKAGLSLNMSRRCPLYSVDPIGLRERLLTYGEIVRNRLTKTS